MRETSVKAKAYCRIDDLICYLKNIDATYCDNEESLADRALIRYLERLEVGVEVKGGVTRVYHQNGIMSVPLAEWDEGIDDGGKPDGEPTDERDDSQESGC